MERLIFGFPRWTPDVTWSGGGWEVAYPVANLGVLPLNRVARSTSLTTSATQFTMTFSAQRRVQLLGLVRHNLSIHAKMRVRIWSDASSTVLVYDSGWIDVWPPVYLPADLEWEDDNWWEGTYSAAEIAGTSATRPIWLGRLYSAHVIKVELDDVTNAAGYVQVGLCEVAQGWQVSVDPTLGFEEGFRFRTEQADAMGGVRYFNRREKPRVARGEIADLPRNEAMGRGYEMWRQFDIDTPFLVLPFPDETLHWLRTAYLARSVDPGRIAWAAANRSRYPIAYEEVL
ncbi:hypothetical protein [Roseococcus sp. YIM B11640]|uniref:hypothetical protein n=1 Tax=Roseococcus sp. YIM B11640 TaxID=3133973 RepID=UPI003C7C167D